MLFIVLGVVIFARLIWVQIFSAEIAYNADRLEGRIFQRQEIKAHRGSILSRDGEPLATSIFKYQVEMDFGAEGFDSLQLFHEQSDSLSKLLSAYFKDRTTEQYKELFRTKRSQKYKLKYRKDTVVPQSDGWFSRMWDRLLGEEFKSVKLYDTLRDHTPVPILPREIDYTEWQTLRKYPILNWNMGMTYNLSSRDERIYPQDEVGRRIIGKLFEDSKYDYGIEMVMSDLLAGQDGKVLRQRIARGFYGRVVGSDNIEAVDGLDVVTTLDLDLMDVVDKSLRKKLTKENAFWGTAVVMDVKSGDILAMSNLGSAPHGGHDEYRYNYAIGFKMEPGSTLKLAAMLALLEVGKFSEYHLIDSGNGEYIPVGKIEVRDSKPGYSEVNLHTAFAQSLNGFFSTAVFETFDNNPTRYTDYLRSINMDKTVGLDVYGEPEPFFPVEGMGGGHWTDSVTLPNMGYGYALEITPLQTMVLYNAVANGGHMVAPRIVKEIRKGDKVVERFPTKTLVSKICSNKTLRKAQELLIEVVETGTAKSTLGGFEGLKIGAKTGTAQVAQSGHNHKAGYYLGSMVAYMPADNPRYTIMVACNNHRSRGAIYGAQLAGPVVKDIVRYLYNRDQEWLAPIDTIKRRNYPTTIKGGDISAVKSVTSRLSPSSARSEKNKGWGVASVDEESKVTVTEIDESHSVMPNVVGMGLKDAIFILENRGLKVSFSGQGRVSRQSIPSGRKISRGDYVSITLK